MTYLKYTATGTFHSKFPEVFASQGRQSLPFVSAFDAEVSCMCLCVRVCVKEKQRKEGLKWRKPENVRVVLLVLYLLQAM